LSLEKIISGKRAFGISIFNKNGLSGGLSLKVSNAGELLRKPLPVSYL
jgi:hypothetical protein